MRGLSSLQQADPLARPPLSLERATVSSVPGCQQKWAFWRAPTAAPEQSGYSADTARGNREGCAVIHFLLRLCGLGTCRAEGAHVSGPQYIPWAPSLSQDVP